MIKLISFIVLTHFFPVQSTYNFKATKVKPRDFRLKATRNFHFIMSLK